MFTHIIGTDTNFTSQLENSLEQVSEQGMRKGLYQKVSVHFFLVFHGHRFIFRSSEYFLKAGWLPETFLAISLLLRRRWRRTRPSMKITMANFLAFPPGRSCYLTVTSWISPYSFSTLTLSLSLNVGLFSVPSSTLCSLLSSSFPAHHYTGPNSVVYFILFCLAALYSYHFYIEFIFHSGYVVVMPSIIFASGTGLLIFVSRYYSVCVDGDQVDSQGVVWSNLVLVVFRAFDIVVVVCTILRLMY